MANRFDGKIAIVTGGAGDIGRAVATRLLDEGASVMIVDLDQGAVDAAVKDLAGKSQKVAGCTADVTCAKDTASYVAATHEAFGGVDILINNAGIEGVVAPLESYPEDSFDQVIAVNVRGVFLGMKYVVNAMRARGGGAIVNLASVAGLSGSPGMVAYNASKHAVIGMTRSAAKSLGPDRIRVNAVCPSPIRGRMMASLESGLSPDDPATVHETLAASIPLQRYGEPAEVASLITYLCSPDAQFMTGGYHTVDGGMTA